VRRSASDDEQVHDLRGPSVVDVARDGQRGLGLAVLGDAEVDPAEELVEVLLELLGGAGGGGRVKRGPAAGQGGVDGGVALLAAPPAEQELFDLVPAGVPAGRQGLADAGGP